MNNSQLKKHCKSLQRVLRLQDWTIEVNFVRQFEMGNPDWMGSCSPCLQAKKAVINIVDPKDFPDGKMTDEEIINTLVHELLHLHLYPIHDDDLSKLEEVALEQAIHSISGAFVSLLKDFK